jgi:hypothetical protein
MKRIFIMMAASAVLLTACAGSRWVRTPVVKDRDFVIAFEQREEKGAVVTGAYAHPADVAPDDLARLLRELTYVEHVGLMVAKTTGNVFQAREVDRLAPALADALKGADGSQRIRFTSYNRGRGLIFSVRRETEGVVFAEPGNRLNIAFARINSRIEPDDAVAFPEDFSGMDPLRIQRADTVLTPISPYGEIKQTSTGEDIPMWMTVDIGAMKQVDVKDPAATIGAPIGSESSTEGSGSKQVDPAAESGNPASAGHMEPSPSLSDESIREEIKNKLKYLKELLDEGLISQQDYDAQKAELLKKIP